MGSLNDRPPQTLYFVEVLVGEEWKRMRLPYFTREAARSWIPFVKKYWNASRSRIHTQHREERTS